MENTTKVKREVCPSKRSGRPSVKPDSAFLLEFYKTHSAREIAEMYDVPVGTVYSWMNKARKELGVGLDE